METIKETISLSCPKGGSINQKIMNVRLVTLDFVPECLEF